MFVLDTNVVSELRKAKAGRANRGVVEWTASTPTDLTFVSAITLFELERGAASLAARDPRQATVLRNWIDNDVKPSFAGRLIAVDADVAARAASLHVPDPAPLRDAFIAATALVHRLAVVTRNSSDFERFEGLEVVNPWG
jgi:toxin FitB